MDILIIYFEGNISIRRIRIDYLVFRFENFRMGDDELIVGFIFKISKIVNEFVVFGKNYMEKSLGKKLMRYLFIFLVWILIIKLF